MGDSLLQRWCYHWLGVPEVAEQFLLVEHVDFTFAFALDHPAGQGKERFHRDVFAHRTTELLAEPFRTALRLLEPVIIRPKGKV